MKGTGENIITGSRNFDLNNFKIKKSFLQSSKRPSGPITAKYFTGSNNVIETKCWIKTLDNPKLAFEVMNRVYHKLKPYELNAQMPIPLGYDLKNKCKFRLI